MYEDDWVDGTNMLGLIACSLVFGIGIAVVGEDADILLKFFIAVVEVMIRISKWIIRLTPIGVLFLIAGELTLA